MKLFYHKDKAILGYCRSEDVLYPHDCLLSFSAKPWRLKAFQSCCLLYCIPFPGMILGLWAAACEGTGLGKFGKPPGGVGRWGNCRWLGPDPGT